MAKRPTKIPALDINDTASVEPTTALTNTGYNLGDRPAHQNINWLFQQLYKWIKHYEHLPWCNWFERKNLYKDDTEAGLVAAVDNVWYTSESEDYPWMCQTGNEMFISKDGYSWMDVGSTAFSVTEFSNGPKSMDYDPVFGYVMGQFTDGDFGWSTSPTSSSYTKVNISGTVNALGGIRHVSGIASVIVADGVSTNARITYSNSSGAATSLVDVTYSGDFKSIEVNADKSRYVAVGENSLCYRGDPGGSLNSGVSAVAAVTSATSATTDFYDITHDPTLDRWWACGNNNALIYSDDDGATWTARSHNALSTVEYRQIVKIPGEEAWLLMARDQDVNNKNRFHLLYTNDDFVTLTEMWALPTDGSSTSNPSVPYIRIGANHDALIESPDSTVTQPYFTNIRTKVI